MLSFWAWECICISLLVNITSFYFQMFINMAYLNTWWMFFGDITLVSNVQFANRLLWWAGLKPSPLLWQKLSVKRVFYCIYLYNMKHPVILNEFISSLSCVSRVECHSHKTPCDRQTDCVRELYNWSLYTSVDFSLRIMLQLIKELYF